MIPDIIQPGADELLQEYDDEIDHALDDEDTTNQILNDLGIQNYETVEKQLSDPIMTKTRSKKCIQKLLEDTKTKRNQLKGCKSAISKQYNSGKISETQRQIENQRIDLANITSNQYIKHY